MGIAAPGLGVLPCSLRLAIHHLEYGMNTPVYEEVLASYSTRTSAGDE